MRRLARNDFRHEMRVLIALLRYRRNPTGNDDLMQILDLLERSMAMDAIGLAFTELCDDDISLFDTDQRGHHGAAVPLCLDRDNFGGLSIGVRLHEIDGGQLAYVLEVARKHELDVREENGWLWLSPHLIESEVTADDQVEETASS